MSGQETATATFSVWRHSGRDAGGGWRETWKGGDEHQARGRFEALACALRQGGVELRRDGEVVARVIGPRLRTRW